MRTFMAAAVTLLLLVAVVAATLVLAGNATPPRPRRAHSEAAIEEQFVARSTPGNALFRKFLSEPVELAALVGAPGDVIDGVRRFLEADLGCSAVALHELKDVLKCKLAAGGDARGDAVRAAVAAAFAAKADARVARVAVTDAAALAAVRGLVRGVVAYRFVEAPRRSRSPSGRGAAGEPGMSQTPQSINKRYKVPSPTPAVGSGVFVGVGEFEGSYYWQSDMDGFSRRYGLRPLRVRLLGVNTSGPAGNVEGELDLEYVAQASNNTVGTWWIGQGSNHQEPGNIDFHDWINKLMAMKADRPSVVSLSWGYGFQRLAFDAAVIPLDNAAFRSAGLAGISVFAASGDSGPGVRSEIFNCDTFTPSWPAASPYVTAVGATYATSEASREIAVQWSGGGFNTVDPTPAWQAEAVRKYLAQPGLPARSFFNASGRAYPDMSAVGTNFQVLADGQWMPVSGTSAASPTAAGIFGLINGVRKLRGKGDKLGFLNPTLYKLGRVGYDVVEGKSQDNNCIPGLLPLPGFPATPGFDAVSGLGTPDFAFLLERFLAQE